MAKKIEGDIGTLQGRCHLKDLMNFLQIEDGEYEFRDKLRRKSTVFGKSLVDEYDIVDLDSLRETLFFRAIRKMLFYSEQPIRHY